ncbi:hypothetical protein [Ketogulonicigenium vulgare]|nr:hypothetical protein [Ketogulonicigenium vulgare]
MSRPVPVFDAPPSAYERLCGAVALLMLISLLIGQIGGQYLPSLRPLNDLASVAAITLALLRLPHVRRAAQVFVGLALIAAISLWIFAPAQMPSLRNALQQGTAFSAFLTTLGLVRGPVRASKLVADAAAYLFAFPAQMRTAAVTFGAQFLTILFNIGTISLLSDIARDHAARSGSDSRAADSITIAALRGTLFATLWNPIGIGFAVVLASISALSPGVFLAAAVIATLVVALGSLWVGRLIEGRPVAAPTSAGGSARALIGLLVAVAALIGATLLLHTLLHISFLVAACIILPAMAFLWPLVEPATRSAAVRNPAKAMGEASAATASEATIFLTATLISTPVALLLQSLGLEVIFTAGVVPPLVFVLAGLLLVPLLAIFYIPHTISFVMVAQIIGGSVIGQNHPLSLGIALMFAWGMAIAISPISAMSLITGRCIGRSTTDVSFRINGWFTIFCLTGAMVIVCAIYIFE